MTQERAGVAAEQFADVRAPRPDADAPVAPTREHVGGATVNGGGDARLLEDTARFRDRWSEIQTAFVDEPREAVERADALVADVIQELARTFVGERRRLEAAWSGGREVSTEDLRVALQRYREFFHVLLRE